MVTLEWLVDHWAPGSLSKEELPGLVDILSRMVRSRPQDRETAYDLLNHPWLQCMTPPHPQPLHSTPSTVPV